MTDRYVIYKDQEQDTTLILSRNQDGISLVMEWSDSTLAVTIEKELVSQFIKDLAYINNSE